jgi:hypothetical protein
MNIDKETIPKLKNEVKWRTYLKGIVIEPEIALNETASCIFRLINGENSIQAMVKEILNEYQSINEEELLKDIILLIERLVEEKVVVL